MNREQKLMPRGVPKYIRCYDNQSKTIDRYTIVYTKKRDYNDEFGFVSMSSKPTWPLGVCSHDASNKIIDRPSYSHLGVPIDFKELPSECKKVVQQDYKELWEIN